MNQYSKSWYVEQENLLSMARYKFLGQSIELGRTNMQLLSNKSNRLLCFKEQQTEHEAFHHGFPQHWNLYRLCDSIRRWVCSICQFIQRLTLFLSNLLLFLHNNIYYSIFTATSVLATICYQELQKRLKLMANSSIQYLAS